MYIPKQLENKEANMMRWNHVVLSFLVAVGLVATGLGQANTGRLDGTVQDAVGAYLAGVKVEARNVGTNATWTTQTNSVGVFIFPVLPVGVYAVTVEAPGFKKFVRENVRVDVAISASVNAKLEVGGVTEEITVTSTGEEVVNKSSPEMSTVIDRRRILDLPLVGRNPIDLAALVPGVTTTGGVRNSVFNGLRESVINITQDGINVQDNFLRSGDGAFIISSPTVENVEQFTITTSTTDASASGSGAAFIRLVTPSGTNDFHGSLFQFHRNTDLNANTFFNNSAGTPQPKLVRNQFGGNVGFPILKNKLFVFASFDETTLATEVTRNRTVLTEDARRGLFRYRGTDGQLREVNLFQAGGLSADPFTTQVLNAYPLPNNTQVGDGLVTGGFRWNVPTYQRVIRPSWRVDWRLTNNHTIEGVFHLARFDTDNDTQNNREPPFPGLKGGFQDSWRRTGSYALRSTFGADKVNEARFGFQTAPVIFGSNSDPLFESGSQRYWIDFPTITDPQLIGITTGRNTQNYQWLDNFTWVRGQHTLRFGGDFRNIIGNETTNATNTTPTIAIGTNQANPSVLQAGQFPSSSANTRTLAQNVYAILIGQIPSVSRLYNVQDPQSGFVEGAIFHNRIQQRYFGAYFSDSWRAKSTLTLNYGLRWDYMSVPDQLNKLALQPVGGDAAFFGLSGAGNLFRPGTLTGSPVLLDLAGASNGRPLYKDDYNNFAPTIGFAWSPESKHWLTTLLFGGAGKGSVRGGYSVAYVLDSISVFTNALETNAGFTRTITLNTTDLGIQSGANFTSFRNGFPRPAAPAFQVPVSQAENFRTNRTGGIFGFAENLRTPYVQSWSFSFARELTRNLALEISYVGNRGVKLYRGIDINETNIFENGFLQEFLIAQNNLAISRANNRGSRFDNQGLAGQQPTLVFSALFAGLTTAQGFGNATFIQLMDQDEVGELASQLYRNSLNALTGARGGLPINFFVANPEAFVSDQITNGSASNFHSLQVELRQRLAAGLQFNFNYTYGKSLTDFAGSGSNFSAYTTIRNLRYEYRRAPFDTRHRVNANFLYELPWGPGKWLLNRNDWVGKAFGGWQINGILIAYTGEPLSITSGRGTFNRQGRSGINRADLLAGMTADDLRRSTSVRREGNGVFFFDPSLIGSDGRAATSLFRNPRAGTLGSLGHGVLSDPPTWNFDFSAFKRVQITERTNLEIRFEFINLFNHTNFDGPNSDINSVNFGRITGLEEGPRVIQLGARLNW
jgi:hypothetical protein